MNNSFRLYQQCQYLPGLFQVVGPSELVLFNGFEVFDNPADFQ